MAFISGIVLMVVGGLIFNSSKDSKADPNWVSIFGIIIFFAGLAALGKGCN